MQWLQCMFRDNYDSSFLLLSIWEKANTGGLFSLCKKYGLEGGGGGGGGKILVFDA